MAGQLKSDANLRVTRGKLLIAHRGASSYAPENTLDAYRLAIKQGAELVEQDLQITKDQVLVCMHDVALETTTDAAQVFPDRFTEREESGKKIRRWLVHDFTLAEVKRLKTRSRAGTSFPATTVPTWQEAIDTIRGKAGLCPETKGPEYYGKLGFNMEELVARVLKKNGLDKARAASKTPVLMQSFSKAGLLRLKNLSVDQPMLWLGFVGTAWTSARLDDAKAQGFASVGPYKGDVSKAMVAEAHRRGLQVIPYTFEPALMPEQFKDLTAEMSHYLHELGVDGLFTNNPDLFPREQAAGA